MCVCMYVCTYVCIHSFIHSFILAISTTQRRSRVQHGYCIGVSHRSSQATAGKGLAQGPYVAARAGVETHDLPVESHRLNKAPPRPTKHQLKPDRHREDQTTSRI